MCGHVAYGAEQGCTDVRECPGESVGMRCARGSIPRGREEGGGGEVRARADIVYPGVRTLVIPIIPSEPGA